MTLVKIDTKRISDEESLHTVFSEAFGFPDFYGKNMSAFVDCLTNLDEQMSKVQVKPGEVVTLQLDHVKDFRQRAPDIYNLIVEACAFVNWRRVDIGHLPIICLSFYA